MHRGLLAIITVVLLGVAVAWRLTTDLATKIPRNQLLTFEALIKQEPRIDGRSQMIRVGDARVYVDLFPRYHVGERMRVRGYVEGNGNLFGAEVQKVGRVAGIWSRVSGSRNRIAGNISQLLPAREATLVLGTVLGVDNIERQFRDALIKTGTIHVVVVSGQNMAIVAGLFLSMARYIGRRQSLALATLAVFSYALLTGFEPPVVRASLMVLFSSIAIYLGREKWGLLSLVLAALIILFFAPQALFELSFQLTFAATLGIMTLGSWLVGKGKEAGIVRGLGKWSKTNNLTSGPNRLLNPNPITLIFGLLWNNAAIASSAYIFTAPIIFFYFARISLSGPIVNILVAELIFPIMILGFLTAAASLIFMPLAQVFAYLAYVPSTIFVLIVNLFS